MNLIVNIFLLLWAISASFYCYRLSSQEPSTKVVVAESLENTSCKAGAVNEVAEIATINTATSIDPTIAKSSEKKTHPHIQGEQEMEQYRISSRLSAIEKFVQLNESQREQLKAKFKSEINNQEAASLEDIIGKDSADFYHKQVKAAYEKSHKEEVDKEVFYLARVLNLSDAQETQVRQVISDVKESADYLSHGSDSTNKINNLQKMLDSVKVQNDLLVEKMKSVLSEEQYRAFIEYQNNSSDSDFALLHDAGSKQ